MTMIEAAVARKAALCAAALAVMLSVAGCAASSAAGPLASHGVDYIPAFDTSSSDNGQG